MGGWRAWEEGDVHGRRAMCMGAGVHGRRAEHVGGGRRVKVGAETHGGGPRHVGQGARPVVGVRDAWWRPKLPKKGGRSCGWGLWRMGGMRGGRRAWVGALDTWVGPRTCV